jgi:hypothetical protein
MSVPDAFSKLLISEGVISAEQLAEAARVAGTAGTKVHDEIVKLNYAPPAKVMAALGKAFRLKVVDLAAMTVPQDVVELLPESVARENTLFPLAEDGNRLRLVTSDPTDMDLQGVERGSLILRKDFGRQQLPIHHLASARGQNAQGRPFARTERQLPVIDLGPAGVPVADQ